MKKILILIILLPIIGVGYLYATRYKKNFQTVLPLPFQFSQNSYPSTQTDAPILIIGDTMSTYLDKFKDRLIENLSINLSKPIKIESMALEGDSIFRTYEKLKSLKRAPLVIIFFNNIDQHFENILANKDISKIQKNINIYDKTNIQTLFYIFPWLARILYNPTFPIVLNAGAQENREEYSDDIIQKREMIHYKLYEYTIQNIFKYTKRNNSFIIPITTPINLDIFPKKSCYGSLNKDSRQDLIKLKTFIKEKDYKSAFTTANELALLNPYNAEVLFLFSQVLKKLGKYQEAQNYGEQAKALDCILKKPNPIYNKIMMAQAKLFEINTFDFHQMLVDESKSNFTFKDATYPQDYYMELLVKLLGKQLKALLRI